MLNQNEKSQSQKNIYRIGWVSFFNDIASEVTIRSLPIYLAKVVNTQIAFIGLIEAISEALAVFIRPLSGSISDKFKKRKPLVLIGYGLSAITRLFLILTPGAVGVLAIRVVDRIGKGIRTAPRDAIISEWSDAKDYGRNFGIHRALDSAGAVLGLGGLGALFLLVPASENNSIKLVMTVAAVFGVIAFFVLTTVKEPVRPASQPHEPVERMRDLLKVPASKDLQKFYTAAFIFALASSSDAFLILRATELGLSLGHLLILLALQNLITVLSALPMGKLSDKYGRKRMLFVGWVFYSAAYAAFASTTTPTGFALILVCYGLFYGFAEGGEKAVIAELSPTARGRAYGFLGFVNGLGLLVANLFTGIIYQTYGAKPAFLIAAAMSLAAASALMLFRFKHRINT